MDSSISCYVTTMNNITCIARVLTGLSLWASNHEILSMPILLVMGIKPTCLQALEFRHNTPILHNKKTQMWQHYTYQNAT